jgi:hypothetical protein
VTAVVKNGSDVVATSMIDALLEARWASADLLARQGAAGASDRLRGRAAELAGSPLGGDQVLSLALDAAAEDLANGRVVLAEGVIAFCGPPVDETERRALREQVFRQGGARALESEQVADELVRRHADEVCSAAALARLLIDDARLHERLWDDPRLPAAPRTRLVMLCSVPKLLARAAQLDPSRARALRRRKSNERAPLPRAWKAGQDALRGGTVWNSPLRHWIPLAAALLAGAAGLMFATDF